MLILSLFCLVAILAGLVELSRGYAQMRSLAEVEPRLGGTLPRVSVIVPACNEERHLEAGLRSLTGQGYPDLEIVVVNDRSTDRTAEVIERVRAEHPAIVAVTIDSLPAGWLGKPHALQRGAELAGGDYLVFTDADVRFATTTIARAVAAMESEVLDHLVLTFRNSSPGGLLNALVGEIGAGLLLVMKPWRARDERSRFFVGVGAFNMVRAEAYRAVGGHGSIRMQVIDDVFLGKILKRAGFSQECRRGQQFLQVPWYRSVGDLVAGLMKNVFAFYHYRLRYAAAGLLVIGVLVLLPYGGVLFADGPARLLFALCILARCISIGTGLIREGVSPSAVFWLLLTPFIMVYVIVRAVALTLSAGGVTWRSTFYPLAELRRQEWVLSGIFGRARG